MSKQLTLSAALSVAAMAALAVATFGGGEADARGGAGQPGWAATAHGSLVSVLLRF